jgi:hypothetical protein
MGNYCGAVCVLRTGKRIEEDIRAEVFRAVEFCIVVNGYQCFDSVLVQDVGTHVPDYITRYTIQVDARLGEVSW